MSENKITEMIESLTEKERNALKEAVTVLWLDDSTDYINGLWDVIRVIMGDDLFNDEEFNLSQIVNKLSPFGD